MPTADDAIFKAFPLQNDSRP